MKFVEEISDGASWILKGRESEAAIPELVGLKQGCLLSPILFNIYTTAILNAVNLAKNGYPLSVSVIVSFMAFADELALFSDSPVKMQKYIDIVSSITSLGIPVNVLKC